MEIDLEFKLSLRLKHEDVSNIFNDFDSNDSGRSGDVRTTDFVRWAVNTCSILVTCVASSADRKENDQTDVEMRSPTMVKADSILFLGISS